MRNAFRMYVGVWLTCGLCLFTIVTHAQTSNNMNIYAVAYVDVLPAAATTASIAFKKYREQSSKEAGYVDMAVLKQLDRAGRFAVIEVWRDQAALEAHGTSVDTQQLQKTLQPLRIGSYDQRLYKPLSTSASPAISDIAIVTLTHVDIAGPQRDSHDRLQQFAQDSRLDDGNQRYDVLQGSTRSNHFTIVAVWRNEAAYAAHAAAMHTRTTRNEIEPMTGSPIDERLYKLID